MVKIKVCDISSGATLFEGTRAECKAFIDGGAWVVVADNRSGTTLWVATPGFWEIMNAIEWPKTPAAAR